MSEPNPGTSLLLMRVALLLAVAASIGCGSRSMVPGPTTPTEQRAPSAPFDIAYQIGWEDPAAHLFDIQIDIGRITGSVVKLQMPVWSPGRYAPFFFARNVTEFSVTGGGAPLRWERESGSLWTIYPGTVSTITVRYRVFANTLSGTFSVLDTNHANWNGPSIFMYVVDHKPDPVRLRVRIPTGWQIVNGDSRSRTQSDYAFENYDRLVDTPTEVAGGLLIDTLRVDGRLYRSMVHHNGSTSVLLRRRFVDDLAKIIRYENTVFDPPPLEMFTFMFNIGFPGGDGMEHLYSTQIISNPRWSTDAAVLPGLSTAAHEYFHVWNMKRVRGAALGPFDYDREQYQTTLWVGEGWTQYYGEMAISRSGVLPAETIYRTAAEIISENLSAPGRKEVSARMSSFLAPFFDGASPGYAVNPDAFFSYYTKGAGIALYLDLFIRGRTNNLKSLDDAFRLLRDRTWNAPSATYYLQGRGYTEEDVVQAVSDVAGVDMRAWFARHVGGTEDMNYAEVASFAGMRVYRDPRVANDVPNNVWRLEPLPNATAAQLRVRNGWISGKTDR
jgi:predicted metalloprotease with PDZ domain